MFEDLKVRLVREMIDKGMIREEDAELYRFGIDALRTYVTVILMTLIVGFLMNTFLESIVFLISFNILRAEAGGYHASSEIKCFIISLCMLIIAFSMIKVTMHVIPITILVGCLIVSCFIIFRYAPIPDRNNRMEEKARLYHKKRARVAAIAESLTATALYTRYENMSVSILAALVVVSASLIITKLFQFKEN